MSCHNNNNTFIYLYIILTAAALDLFSTYHTRLTCGCYFLIFVFLEFCLAFRRPKPQLALPIAMSLLLIEATHNFHLFHSISPTSGNFFYIYPITRVP